MAEKKREIKKGLPITELPTQKLWLSFDIEDVKMLGFNPKETTTAILKEFVRNKLKLPVKKSRSSIVRQLKEKLGIKKEKVTLKDIYEAIEKMKR